MKYITFAFDDGLEDFLLNAKPLFDEFKYKATLNIISGFLNKKGYFSVDNAKILAKDGYELCMHGEQHLLIETVDDFRLCYSRFLQFFGYDNYGVTLPYNQNISNSLFNYFKSISVPYIAVGKLNPTKNFKHILHMLFKRKHKFLCANYPFINFNLHFNKEPIIFNRIRADVHNKPANFMELVKIMPSNSYLIITFHSIMNSEDDNCIFKEGIWTVNKLRELLYLISLEKDIKVVTHKDLINMIKID